MTLPLQIVTLLPFGVKPGKGGPSLKYEVCDDQKDATY